VIDEFVVAFTLTLARVGTFIHVLPILGGPNMPRTVKIGLAMALAGLFFGDASRTLALAGGTAPLGLTSWVGLGLALGREMLLGGVLGFALGLFLVPAHVAAEFITQEAGMSFANVLTASGNGGSNALTVVFELLASVAFLALDLHHVFLLLLQETFQHLPIGQGFQLPNWDLVTAAGAAEEGGLLLVAPVGLCLFVTTVVLALMTRAAPQLNLYSVGFPLRVLVCLGAVVVLLPSMLTGMIGMFSYFLELLQLRG
jgi:flagellar biosynthetic protein FliR